MCRHIAKLVILLTLMLVSIEVAQTSDDNGNTLRSAIERIGGELQQLVTCGDGKTAKVGVWPLDAESLPISPESAAQVYDLVLTDLISAIPECVAFFDGAGAGEALNYLNRAGAFHVVGTNQRAQIEAALRDVDFIVSVNVFDRGGTIMAAVKFLEISGQTLAAPPAFAVPEQLLNQSCGAGAVPLHTALQRAAASFRENVPDMRKLVNDGGYYADTGERTSFAGFAGQLFVANLVRLYTDPISERQLLISEGGDGSATGTYRLRFRYWPCDGNDRLVILAQLSSATGAIASWNGPVLTANLPEHISIAPVSALPENWSLSVTPRNAAVDDEIAVVAEVPASCTPIFVDFAPSGVATVIPQQYFVIQDMDDGGRRFRVDSSTRFGLQITPEDEKGMHHLGYFCHLSGENASIDELRAMWLEMAAGSGRQIHDQNGQNFWFENYEVR